MVSAGAARIVEDIIMKHIPADWRTRHAADQPALTEDEACWRLDQVWADLRARYLGANGYDPQRTAQDAAGQRDDAA